MSTLPSLGRFVLAALLAVFAANASRASVQIQMVGGNSPLRGQAAPGATVKLQVKAIGQGGNPEAQVGFGELDLTKARYQWFHDGALLPGATASELTLPNVTTADAGNYSVQVASTARPADLGTIALNVAPAPGASFVDVSFAAPKTTRPYWNYEDLIQVSRIDQVLPDGSVVVSGMSVGDMKGWRVLGPDGRVINTWVADVVHYGFAVRVWPDGTVVTTATNGPTPPRISVSRLDGAQPFTLPAGFEYSSVGLVLVDGVDLLLSQGGELVRLNAARERDATFAPALPADTRLIADLKLDAAGRYLVTVLLADNTARLLRLGHDGSADPTFTIFPLEHYRSTPAVPLDTAWIGPFPQADGGILWAVPDPQESATELVRLRADGMRDTAFQARIPFAGTSQIDAQGRVYVNRYGRLVRYRTAGGAELDAGFYPGTPEGAVYGFTLDGEGRVLVYGAFTSWDGHATNQVARLRPDAAAAPTLPAVWLDTRIAGNPGWVHVQPGDRVTMDAGILGTGPFTYEWVNLDGGSLPSEAHAASLTFASFSPQNFGRYQLRLTSPAGVSLSDVIDLSANSLPLVGLVNLSGQAMVGTGENALIAGFVQEGGNRARSFLLRAAGPALTQFGVSPVAADPVLTLFDAAGTVVGQNDNWASATDEAGIVGAFPFVVGSADAQLWTQCAGLHSLQVTNRGATAGRALVEIYDAYPASFYLGRLVNLSLRAYAGTGNDVAIAGFVIRDPSGFGRPLTVLVRAVGPTLAGQGIQHPLADPTLSLMNTSGAVVARNGDWSAVSDPLAVSAAAAQVGAFALPAGSKDAALLVQLPAGAYTVHAAGADGGTGVVLMEIYLVR